MYNDGLGIVVGVVVVPTMVIAARVIVVIYARDNNVGALWWSISDKDMMFVGSGRAGGGGGVTHTWLVLLYLSSDSHTCRLKSADVGYYFYCKVPTYIDMDGFI